MTYAAAIATIVSHTKEKRFIPIFHSLKLNSRHSAAVSSFCISLPSHFQWAAGWEINPYPYRKSIRTMQEPAEGSSGLTLPQCHSRPLSDIIDP